MTTTVISKAQEFRATMVPVFMPANMEQPMADQAATQEQYIAPSLLDVKELYDRAYDRKAEGGEEEFKEILAEAVKLDLAYRRELNKNAYYKEPSKKENFETASDGSKVA